MGIDIRVFRLGGETDSHTTHVPGHTEKINTQRKLQLNNIFSWVYVKNRMVLRAGGN